MTNEEAISILKNAAFLSTKTKYQAIEEAVNTAIEALKAQDGTDVNVGDMINRHAAITAIQKEYADTEGGEDKCAVWKNVGLTSALHIIQDLPSVQPDDFLKFLWNVINPNEMQGYLEMYWSGEEKTNG